MTFTRCLLESRGHSASRRHRRQPTPRVLVAPAEKGVPSRSLRAVPCARRRPPGRPPTPRPSAVTRCRPMPPRLPGASCLIRCRPRAHSDKEQNGYGGSTEAGRSRRGPACREGRAAWEERSIVRPSIGSGHRRAPQRRWESPVCRSPEASPKGTGRRRQKAERRRLAASIPVPMPGDATRPWTTPHVGRSARRAGEARPPYPENRAPYARGSPSEQYSSKD